MHAAGGTRGYGEDTRSARHARGSGCGGTSARVTVEVNSGSTVYFKADMPRNRNLLNRMMKAMFDPFHSLVLEEMTGSPVPSWFHRSGLASSLAVTGGTD